MGVLPVAKKKSIFQRIRFVYRPSKPIVKWVVLAMVVFCTAALIVLGVAIDAAEKQEEEGRVLAILLEQKNERLEQYIAELGTVPGVIRIAREQLGLEDPDAIIFESVQPTDPN